MLRRTLAALVAGTVLLASCTGDDAGDGPERNAHTEAMAARMAGAEDLPITDEGRRCLASGFVDALGGAGTLEDEGITPEQLAAGEDLTALGLELGEEEADAVAAAFGDCDVSLVEVLLAEAPEDLPDEVRTCVEERLDEDVLADFFTTALLADGDDGEDPAALLEPVLACF